MSGAPPLLFRWDGEAFHPVNRTFARICDKYFVVPEVYRLEVHEERSGVSHRHFFAALNEAWKNLPENLTAEYPSVEHLRKKALVKAGYADETSVVCDTKPDAKKLAAFAARMDTYAVVVVRANIVKVFTAQSQSAREMNKERFQASKTAVLNIVASMIGVDPDALSSNAEEAPQKAQERVAEPAPPAATPEPEQDATAALRADMASLQMPRNLKEYTAWFKVWLADMGSAEDVTDRWSAERNLRNKCGVTAEDRKPLEDAKAKRIAELRE